MVALSTCTAVCKVESISLVVFCQHLATKLFTSKIEIITVWMVFALFVTTDLIEVIVSALIDILLKLLRDNITAKN